MKRYIEYIMLIILFGNTSVVISQHITMNDIWNKKTITDTTTLHFAKKYLDKLSSNKRLDSVIVLSKKVIQAASNYNDLTILGDTYLKRARAYSELNKYFYANQNYKEGIKVYTQQCDKERLADAFNSLYFLEYYRGNLTEAAGYLLESKAYYKQINNVFGMMISNNYLGDLYAKLDNFDLAEKYYKKAIRLHKKKVTKDKGIGLYMNNLSYLYINYKMPKKAKRIVKSALPINKKNEMPIYTIYSYYILAKIALYQKEYTTSQKYYDTVLQMGSKTKSFALTIPLIISKQQMACIALETRNYKKAEHLLKKAREEFLALKDIDPTEHLLSNYQIAAKLDSVRGNLYEAFIWQKKYLELSDHRISEIVTKKIEQTEGHHKEELEYLRLIDRQKKEEREAKASLFKYRLCTFISSILLLIIAIFLVWIIRTRKERKRYIRELNNSNEIKNKLFSIISHDLKNEIHGLEGSLNLLNDNSISTEDFKEILPLLVNRTSQTSILLHNLLNWSKSQLKELNTNPTNFDIDEVISDKFIFFNAKAEQKNIKLINKLNPTIIYADKDMFAIVSQNLIANAIKFCNPGDSIALLSKENEAYYEICFQDTGVGIDPVHLEKLFAEETFTTNGTHDEGGTGLGLKICKELIELNNGKIEVKSILGEGSTFCVFLPKAA